MTRLARRLARRYLPTRLRAAGLALVGRPTGFDVHQGAGRAAKTAKAKTATGTKSPAKKTAAKKTPAKKTAAKKTAAKTTAVPEKLPAPLVESLRRGVSLGDAVSAQARAMVAAGDADGAYALGLALKNDPGTEQVGRLATGTVAGLRSHHHLAWREFEPLPTASVARSAASELVRAGLAADAPALIDRLTDLAATDPHEVPAESWLALIGPVYGFGAHDLAQALFARFDQRVGDGTGVSSALVIQRDWLQPWIARRPDGRSADPVPAGRVSFAIMDYGHPSRTVASNNIGDHIQSLASLGHLVRHQNLSYHGPSDLVSLVEQLRGRVRPELALEQVDGEVQLIQIDRDASAYAEVPPDTWALAFGWYMHPIFGQTYGFPFHPNLLPLFLSFHCSRRALLTPEAIDYLRRFAPIGCRDWTTVDILLSIGVPAFFSGCLTTTINTVFPDSERAPADAPIGYVDVAAASVPAGATTYAHQYDEVRFTSFVDNVYAGMSRLETYRREHGSLVTSRLHCYLPSRSIGIPVDFQPKNRSDPRFAGLIDITDREFDRIRSTVNTRVAEVMSLILAGRPAEEVYARWREVNADDVAAAEARRAAVNPPRKPRSNLVSDVARVALGRQRSADGLADPPDGTVHVAVHAARDQRRPLAALINSIGARTARPVRVVVLSRDLQAEEVPASAHDNVAVELLRTDGLGKDLRRGDGRAMSNRDTDLLAVADILTEADRIVVLPVAAVVRADLGDLADLDLDGELLAAPTTTSSQSGFVLIHTAGSRLQAKTQVATELRRQAYARHAFDFDAFDTDVMVIDAAEFRRRELLSTAVPLIEEFGLTLRELLHFEVGPHRAVVPARWHVVPSRSAVTDAALLHWADAAKPWTEVLAPDQDLWFETLC